MPKLNVKNPVLGAKEGRAVVRYKGKTHYLKKPDGTSCKPNTKEALIAYNRLCIELQKNSGYIAPRGYAAPAGESDITIAELAAAYLTYAKQRLRSDYSNVKTIIEDFLLQLFGDEYPVNSFTPKCLKKVRESMVQSQRFSRGTINKYTSRIGTIFAWGVSEELVQETTHRALKTVRQLEEGHEGTRENAPREDISFDVVNQVLAAMVPTLRAMVKIHTLHGMRSGDICNMRVGEIDRSKVHETGLWYYTPGHYKTEKITGIKMVFPLAEYEQKLIEPYLVGKSAEEAVFSPRTAMKEHAAERRANRKTKQTPSALAKEQERAKKPQPYAEFYTPDAYRKAVKYAIAKANRLAPENEKIPHWYPYLLRHTAITVTSLENGKDAAQALAGHTSSRMTDNYDHSQLRKREVLAKNRRIPFAQNKDDIG
jgi:integrase